LCSVLWIMLSLFSYSRLETGRIMWLGMAGWLAGVHTGFRIMILVLYIGSLPNLVTWFHCGRGRTLFILGSLGQRSRSRYYKYIFWQQGRFHMITLVMYIGSLPNLTIWVPCRSGRILFIVMSLGQRSRSLLL
jgi:hypothetical protein